MQKSIDDRSRDGLDGGWIGVDFDGVLAEYHSGEYRAGELGPPVPAMVRRVKAWLAEGRDVRIFTARCSNSFGDIPDLALRIHEAAENMRAIYVWCETHIGRRLDVTCIKDSRCDRIYDDRAVQIVRNEGREINQARDALSVDETYKRILDSIKHLD